MSEYNIRQYKMMLERIERYQKETLSLRHLIDDLEGLLDCLEVIEEEWKDSFQREWGVLEEVYACLKYECREELDGLDKQLIEKTLVNLRKLVSERLKREEG